MNVIVYKTTNRVNCKIYIGIHETTNPSSFDGYLGSGKALKAAIRKYGKDAFQRETLYLCDAVKEAAELEALIVDEEFVSRKNTYNMTVGGGVPPSKLGFKHSEEQRKRMSLSRQTQQYFAKMSGERNPSKRQDVRQKLSSVMCGNTNGAIKHKKVECPYCRKVGGNNMMQRYHFSNCKKRVA